MTDEPAPDTPPRPGLRIHPSEIWDLARRDYLAGVSGPAVCARYGLGLAAFRKRAATGGWRRIDQPPPLPTGPLEIDGDLDEAGYFDLADMAVIHLREAIVNGCVGQARPGSGCTCGSMRRPARNSPSSRPSGPTRTSG